MPPKPPAHRPPAERREAREAWQLMVTVPGIARTGVAENRHHYVRDNRWREDRGTWRTGDGAFVMFVLLPRVRLLRTCGLP